MGMAASQARFLGLTARKTNTEYEGQQINQQRTTLGNQSANYYNQLLGMTVPVPPSIDDYTKTIYTFSDGAVTNTLTSMIAQRDGKYIVSYTTSWNDNNAVVSASPSIYTKDGNIYRCGASKLRELGSAPANLEDDLYYKSLPADQREKLLAEENLYKEKLNREYGGSGSWLVRYVQDTTSGTWSPFYVKREDLLSEGESWSSGGVTYNGHVVYNEDTGNSLSSIKTYTLGAKTVTNEIKNVDARLEHDASGRIIKITLYPDQPDEVTCDISTTTTTDQDKYTDAMNQYEYNKYQYDQTIQEVNAKIEIIQAEDRNLELRLKQLDTEQTAIQTEMEAVQKVIEKNTESTFKTFG